MSKSLRTEDSALMDQVRNSRCVITGNFPPNDPHHVKSKGSGGPDEPWNLCPLRHDLHQEFHKIGISSFAEKYPAFKSWLEKNGWEYNDHLNKWRHHERD